MEKTGKNRNGDKQKEVQEYKWPTNRPSRV